MQPVYKLDPTGKEFVIHSFTGLDGANPLTGVIRDSRGNLYGATNAGGTAYGVVYKLDPTGYETVLYTFTGRADGGTPRRLKIMWFSHGHSGLAAPNGISRLQTSHREPF